VRAQGEREGAVTEYLGFSSMDYFTNEVALGKLAKGKPKNFSKEEIKRRTNLLVKARKSKRMPKITTRPTT
jgi:hypothetical protein